MSGPLHCSDAIDRLQDSLDERQGPLTRSPWIAAHLADCRPCRKQAAGLERVDGLGKRIARELRPAPVERAGAVRIGACFVAAAAFLLAVVGPFSLTVPGGPRGLTARSAALTRFADARDLDQLEVALRERNALFAGVVR